MKKTIKGAWIVSHTHKLQTVVTRGEFSGIELAGKCGLLLSGLVANEDSSLTTKQVSAIAQAAGVNPRTELPAVLEQLQRQKLIALAKHGIDVLGLSSPAVLEHTANIFDEADASPQEHASLQLAEAASNLPLLGTGLSEQISDEFKIAKKDTADLIEAAESIGFVEAAELGTGDKLYFNGNLFKKDDATKINAVLSSLSPADVVKVTEFQDLLQAQGCVALAKAHGVLGQTLFKKLHAIGVFDSNEVSNEHGVFTFVTRPAAFAKYTGSIVDDAFDLAKAFVTSLTYGMTQSSAGRGRIRMIEALMQKLIRGQWIGPATAIGKDYQILELRRVVETQPAGKGMYFMRLLKAEVGKLALAVIQTGDAAPEALPLPTAAVASYRGPEPIRHASRRELSKPVRSGISELISAVRTGGLRRS
jgi:hypothetical protein